MTKNRHAFLRVHVEESNQPKPSDLSDLGSVQRLCNAFADATGWAMSYHREPRAPHHTGWARQIGSATGSGQDQLVIESRRDHAGSSSSGRGLPIGRDTVEQLADATSEVLDELHQTRRALWEREAELATCVPITTHADEAKHFAQRLESVLKTGAESVDCQASAVYLLDDATKRLKLRACWGLPKSRFLDPPRPLRGAAADLEALVGHAVALEDTKFLTEWRVPEEFRAAVCVPISSPTTLLGTLWVFCDQPRKFAEKVTNLIELTAGRIAADLERQMLLGQLLGARVQDRQLEHAAEWQRHRLPRIKPLLDGWEVAGWNVQAEALGGDFYDWIVLPNGSLAVALGDAQGKMSEAALTASTVHTAIRSHADYRHTAQSLVRRVNETLWTASVGDQFASLFYGTIQPETGEVEYAMAGHVYGAIIGERPRPFSAPDELPLGTQPDSEVTGYEDRLERGELLVMISEGVYRLLRASRCRVLWRMLHAHRDLSVDELLEKACAFLRRQENGPSGEDMTILIVKRT